MMTIWLNRLLLTLPIWLMLVTDASAVFVQTAKVRYQQGYSKSQWYTVEVTFATGSELNRATSSFDYNSYDEYAVVFWGPGEATIIELDGFRVCFGEFTESCLSIFSNMKGVDQNGRKWDVCTGSFCY